MPEGIPKTSQMIKVVIKELKQGPKLRSDLEKLTLSSGRAIPHSSLDRILNRYLLDWGLVEKEKDYKGREKWIWHELPRFESKHEYDVLLRHSRNLILGLESISAKLSLEGLSNELIGTERRKVQKKRFERGRKYFLLALEHLGTGYGEIFENFLLYLELTKENKKMLDESRKSFDERLKELARVNVPKSRLAKIIRTAKISVGQEIPVSREQYFNELTRRKKRIELEVRHCTREEVLYKQLIGDISLLIRRIDEGQPLAGNCTLCPRVRIID